MGIWRLRTERYFWLAGLYSGLIGIVILVTPHELRFLDMHAQPGSFFFLGAFMLCVGMALVFQQVFPVRAWFSQLAVASSAAAFWGVAALLIPAGAWVSAINLVVLGGASVLAGMQRRDALGRSHADLLVVSVGLSLLVSGVAMTFTPLSTLNYYLDGPLRLIFGAAFAVTGAALLAAEIWAGSVFHRVRRSVIRVASLLLLLFLAAAVRPEIFWFGSIYYGWFGMALLFLSRLFPDNHPGNSPSRLQTRLAVAFGAAATTPLALVLGLINWIFSDSFIMGSDVEVAAERDLTMAIVLVTLAVMAYAGLVVARWLVSPLGPLRNAALALAEGDTSVRLPGSTIVELQQLSTAFSDMRLRLTEQDQVRRAAQQALEEQQQLLEVRVMERTAELAFANQRMRALLDALPVGVMMTDAQGQVLEKNEAFDLVWGERMPELRHMNDYAAFTAWRAPTNEPISPEDWALARAVQRGEVTLGNIIDIRRHDGTNATILDAAAPVYDAQGKILGGVAVAQDISKQREAEHIAREAARRARKTALEMEAIFDGLTDAVILYDTTGVIQQANARAVAMFGFDPLRMTTAQVTRRLEVTSEEGLRIASEMMPSSQALEGKSMSNFPVRFRNNRGRQYTALISASPLYLGTEVTGVVAIWHDVTERERLMMENRRQRELLERLVHEAPAGIAFLTGEELEYSLVNAAYENIARGKGPLLGRNVLDVFSEIAEEIKPLLEGVQLRGEAVRMINHRFVIQRGGVNEEDFFTFSFVPIYDTARRIEGVMILAIETTEEVRAQQAVENERSWLEAIMQHAPEGILVVDYEGNLQFSNTAVERIMGRPLIGNLSALEPGLRIFYSDGSPYPLENIPLVRHAIAGHSSINNHLHVERLDGACVPLLLSVAPVRSQTGEVTSAVVIFQDITHIVQAEQALRESEARFRGLVQSLNDIVYTLDETGCITGVYGRGLDRLGLSKQAVLGKHLREIFPTPANIHEAAMERALGGEGQVYEWVTSTRLGALHFQNAVSPLQDEQGSVNGVVCLSRDVTLYRQAEQSLKNYADRLRRSNMELEQFAFIASHDLQEPLRKIHAFGQRLLQRFRDRADTEDLDYMERMINAADRMQKMIIDLLAFSRVTTKGQPFEQVNLNAVISDVISDLEVRIERTGGKVLVSALPDLQADPLQMHQLFQNLIGNGLKYHRADLPPELHIRGALVPRGKAAGGGSQAHDDRAAQELVQITISDNGIGFDEQYLERIFQPFERLHGRSEYEGTGMGLAICNKIIERHHGTITAHSQPGQGATFVIILPRKQENRDLDDGLEV